MFFLNKIIEELGITRMEAIGCLYVKGMPIDLVDYPTVKISAAQRSVLFQYYILSDAVDKPLLYNGDNLLGVLSFYNKERHYGCIISNTFQLMDKNFYFDGTDFYYNGEEDVFIPGKGLFVFNLTEVNGFMVAVNIRQYDVLKHKKLAVNRVLRANLINHLGIPKINIYQISNLHCYDLLKNVFEAQCLDKEILTRNIRIIQKAVGGRLPFFNAVESESNEFPEEYESICKKISSLDTSLQEELIRNYMALCNIVSVDFLISRIVDYTEKNFHHNLSILSKKEQELNAFELLQFKKELREKTVLQLSKELSRAYCEYSENHSDKSYNHYEDTTDRDNWNAMTDGMYGDYPDDGFDGDYESLGY